MTHPPGVTALTSAAGVAEPISGLKGASAFILIAAVVVVIAGVAAVPLIMDVRRATAWRTGSPTT